MRFTKLGHSCVRLDKDGAVLVIDPGTFTDAAEALAGAAADLGNTQQVGLLLYSRYLFPFEITSIILLVAMIGAIVIARGLRETAPAEPASAPAVAGAPDDAPGEDA